MLLFRFFKNREGVFAPLFAMALVPIVGMVGAAVDYSRASSVRTSMIAALDSTALMLSKEANFVNASELNAKANSYFKALFVNPNAKNVTVTIGFTELDNKFTLTLNASATIDADFTRIFGQDSINLRGSSEVKWGFRKLELALVLDNTGSMSSSNKMTELKKASKSLLDTLQKAAKKPDDIKVAIIPFDTTVNLGNEYKNDFWITYRSGINKNNWEGCVRDRDKDTNLNYDVLDTPPVQGVSNTYFQVEDCGSLAKAMPLSSDFTALKTKIDEMVPAGMTNVTIGLAWGWHALTGNTPYTNASAPHPELDKVIVMLTDGKNTQNRWSTNESSINARTSAACANIKAAGIKLYTVRVIDGNASLLQACATQPKSTDAQIKYYHDVDTASELEKVFQDIAHSLTSLRIAK